jgi:hypothetical protein
VFSVSGRSGPSGYNIIDVTAVSWSTASPFANGDPILVHFDRTGDKGDAGPTGGAVAIRYIFSTTTTDSDPGSGNLRLDNSTQNTATTIRADALDTNGDDWSTVLASFSEALQGKTGFIRLVKENDLTKWIFLRTTHTNDVSGYYNISVTVQASSDANPFMNGDAVVLH